MLLLLPLVCGFTAGWGADWSCIFDFGDQSTQRFGVNRTEVEVVYSRCFDYVDDFFEQEDHVLLRFYVKTSNLFDVSILTHTLPGVNHQCSSPSRHK